MEIKGLISMGTMALALSACGEPISKQTQWITIDNGAGAELRSSFPDSVQLIDKSDSTSILAMAPDAQGEIGEFMHEIFNRCGGYFSFETETEALAFQIQQRKAAAAVQPQFDYSINQGTIVAQMTENVSPTRIISTIRKMSDYRNRYFRSATGTESQSWLKSHWESLGEGRGDFSVELFNHSGWPQPSVIATIVGSEYPDEVVILGGHGDSISGYFRRESARAPGADDNASGIATITEAMKIILASDWRPKRTLKFMSYAAEEVGLKGSKEIANSFQRQGKQVTGVMQLDMTAFVGARGLIGFMRDHTNDTLSLFTQSLLDTYVTNQWVDDRCGYACSDHASWTAAGYPSVMPFEATYNESNSKIHTPNDTIRNADSSGLHSAKFAKLGLAFMVEISK